jgi:hypothetical protein
VTTGKTPALDVSAWRKLLDAIRPVRDLRDRALIGPPHLFLCPRRRGPEAEGEDLRPNGTGLQIHLHEKRGEEHKMPCRHALSEMLPPAAIADDRKGWLFRPTPGHNATALTADESISGMVHGPKWRGENLFTADRCGAEALQPLPGHR